MVCKFAELRCVGTPARNNRSLISSSLHLRFHGQMREFVSLLLCLCSLFACLSESSAKIVISETVAHTDPPYYDYIELHNTKSEPVDISGLGLSESGSQRDQIVLPQGTILGPEVSKL